MISHRVLIIDDDPTCLRVLSQIVSTLNCRCDCVSTGRQAIAIANTQTFSLILLDVKLPDLDGHAVCTQLKRCSQHRSSLR
jgi:DNA-binding response OmpR family regulator